MSDSAITLSHSRSGNRNLPLVLFLHGFMGRKEDWADTIEALQNDYHCVAVDLPGHGSTLQGSDSDYSMHSCAEALVRFIDDQLLKPVGLVGYSMGGRLAIYFALQYPEYVSAMVLESASPGLRTESERAVRIEKDGALAKRLRDEPLDEFIERWYSQPLFQHLVESEGLLSRLIESRIENDPAALAISLEQMGTGVQPSLWEELSSLDIPTLILAGENDSKFSILADQMCRLCGRAQKLIIPDAGHIVHLEKAAEYQEAICSFLKQNP
jgi:2-succinyl-6-hydroxy-2,4-cyclohexadiene-1-carboxylate synthase